MRLIDADRLLAEIKTLPIMSNWGETFFPRLVQDQPTVDAEPVVRCKDCGAWKRNVGIVDSPNGHCFEHDIDTNGQDFCSYGERREGDNDNVSD